MEDSTLQTQWKSRSEIEPSAELQKVKRVRAVNDSSREVSAMFKKGGGGGGGGSSSSSSRRCGECDGCFMTENCGRCENCKHLKKYGKSGRVKIKCKKRMCLNMMQTSSK